MGISTYGHVGLVIRQGTAARAWRQVLGDAHTRGPRDKRPAAEHRAAACARISIRVGRARVFSRRGCAQVRATAQRRRGSSVSVFVSGNVCIWKLPIFIETENRKAMRVVVECSPCRAKRAASRIHGGAGAVEFGSGRRAAEARPGCARPRKSPPPCVCACACACACAY